MKNDGSIVVFGCGEIGYRAMQFLKLEHPEETIVFCDNYVQMVDYDIELEVINFEQLKNLSYQYLYIAANRFQEIYEQCIVNKIRVDGVYDADSNQILSYFDYCLLKSTGYSNEKYIYFRSEWEKLVQVKIEKFKEQKILSNNVARVSIMLSNLCNYAAIHPQCPASKEKEKWIVSLDNYKKIIHELYEVNFYGILAYHIYNEPLMDPRLFYMLDYAKRELKHCTRLVYTNGYYLNQTMVNDLKQFSDVLVVTGYGKHEYERIMNLQIDIPFHIEYGHLDERLNNYDEKPMKEQNEICRALISDCSIFANGDLGLCCLDYKHKYNLGNVFNEGFKNVLDREDNIKLQMKLLNGERDTYQLCRGCTWSR